MPAERRIGWIGWGLLAACAVLLAPLLPAVMLALWLGALARVLHAPLSRALGGRVRLAAAITLVVLVVIVIPFALVITSLAVDAYELVMQLLQSPRGKAVLEQLVAPKGSAEPGTSSLWHLIFSQQERAWGILQQIAGTTTRVVIGLVVIFAGAYAVLVDGARGYRWLEQHAPVPPALLGRLRDAFYETGRGLFIGIGGAGLVQASIATILYLVLRVPHALELGLLTFCFSVVPAVGTALVWVPVAVGLAWADRTGAAIALAVCGIAVIGTVDNLVRPVLARRGRLQLPTYVVLVAMFAGVQVIGAWGLLIAPLAVRLAKAALEASAADGRD
ncbi:MAG TPA: AI-2E family transporter [Kofleriaceae bacterium]